MALAPKAPTWEEIDRCESYLVCSMFKEAASSALSVLKQLCEIKSNEISGGYEDDSDLNDKLESAGMVFIQSLKELGRTADIMNELKLLFGSATAIPIEVFIAGLCLQLSHGSYCDVKELLEEFVSSWKYTDQKVYLVAGVEDDTITMNGYNNQVFLGVHKYLEVVEIYVATLLGTVTRNIDVAISWVEKAALPEEKRQDLLRRLYSMHSSNVSSPNVSVSPLNAANESVVHSTMHAEENIYNGHAKDIEGRTSSASESSRKQNLIELYERKVPCLWWFRTITLKFRNKQLVLSNGNILLGFLALLISYLVRRKQADFKRMFGNWVSSLKKASNDFWQLAFSYQVNPLAAVQHLPASARGAQR